MTRLILTLAAALALALPTAPALACSATQTIDLTLPGNNWEGGRQDLYKSLRYIVTRTNTTRLSEQDATLIDNHIGIEVQYQKQKHLLCEIVPGGPDICEWFRGTAFHIDNRYNQENWHTSLHYTITPGTADSTGVAAFSQDFISGTYNTTNNNLITLTVNSPGRVVFSKPVGNVQLSGC